MTSKHRNIEISNSLNRACLLRQPADSDEAKAQPSPPAGGFGEVKGAVTLPVFLMITLIIFELAIAGVVVANALNNSFFGERLSAEAWQAARAGAQDAIILVVRKCPLSDCNPSSYSLAVGGRSTAQVSIARDPVSGKITVNSTGESFTRKKKIEVILGVDQETGQVKVQSFKEVAL